MKLAVVERLNELTVAAKRLAALLESEDAANPLPGLLLARAAVAVDDAASKLAQHVAALASAVEGDAH